MNEPLLPAPGPDYATTGPAEDHGSAAAVLRLRRLLVFLWQYWWIPVLTLLLGVMAEAAFVYWKSPNYVSQAAMFETIKITLPEGSLFSEDVQNFLGTQTELLRSGTMRGLALQRLGMITNTFRIPTDKEGHPLPVAVNVSGSAKSSVFVIVASSANALYTQYYLDALMSAYLDYKRNIRQVVSGDTLNSISEQVQRWERDLKTEQDALTAFQRSNNLAMVEEEGTIAGGYLARLKTQLSDLQLEARLLDAAQQDEKKSASGDTNAPIALTDLVGATGSGASAGSLDQQASFKELQMLKIQRARLSKYLRPKHPKIVKLDADIDRAEKLQQIYRQQNREQLAAARQANQLKTENVVTSIKEWEVKVDSAKNIIAEAGRLQRNVQRVQGVYDRLQSLVQNVGISRNIDQESLAVLEHASAAERSFKQEIIGLLLSLFGGLAAGLGIVFLISVRDDRFTSVTEVNSALGDAVVGLLPEVAQAKNSPMPLLELNDPRHIYAESYRSLRSALLFLPIEGERPKVLLVTSALPNEGKSTVAVNLARTLALSGSRVLLVDGDLRKGHIHRLMELPSEPGLTELLNRDCDVEKVIQANSLPNFFFVSRGKNSGNPGDLFLGSNLDQILARWRREYDFVVLDSSPLFAADDASCLAPKVDGTLFVVRRNYSSARAVREALELLAQRQARVLGVVFNGADPSARSYYYYKYADYYSPAKTG